MKKVLACVDGSIYSDGVCRYAAWASGAIGAGVELLTVLPDAPDAASHSDLSGAIGLDANSELLGKLAEEDVARGQAELRKGREILESAERLLREAGVEEVTTLKGRGALVETIRRFEEDKEIIIIGKRGTLADQYAAHISPNMERIARAVQRPLLVTPKTFKPVQRFLIAFDGGAGSSKAVEYIRANPLLKGLECHIVTVGQDAGQALDSAADSLRTAGFTVSQSVEEGHPDSAIQSYVASNDIDLLVIGAYGHSHLRTLIIGSTTTSMIMSSPVPLLLFR